MECHDTITGRDFVLNVTAVHSLQHFIAISPTWIFQSVDSTTCRQYVLFWLASVQHCYWLSEVELPASADMWHVSTWTRSWRCWMSSAWCENNECWDNCTEDDRRKTHIAADPLCSKAVSTHQWHFMFQHNNWLIDWAGFNVSTNTV